VEEDIQFKWFRYLKKLHDFRYAQAIKPGPTDSSATVISVVKINICVDKTWNVPDY